MYAFINQNSASSLYLNVFSLEFIKAFLFINSTLYLPHLPLRRTSLPLRTSPTRTNQTTTKNQESNVSFKQKLTLLLNIPVIIIQSLKYSIVWILKIHPIIQRFQVKNMQ